ncbi:unnamed protein product [marine sediment metagenome]|uniref:Uncharacterized protein n=1 Tax=marine sediment metagenome TaxID=412755 RepID=X1IBR5_9ZZZZ
MQKSSGNVLVNGDAGDVDELSNALLQRPSATANVKRAGHSVKAQTFDSSERVNILKDICVEKLQIQCAANQDEMRG